VKDLVKKAYEMGYKAFPHMRCIPSKNEEFVKLIPSSCNYKSKLYKEYIKGWVKAFIDKIFKDQ